MLQLFIIAVMMINNAALEVTSPSFANNGSIPFKFSCEGDNVNPELSIKNIPGEAKSLALIVDDPDAPNGTFDHWVMWNIPPKEKIAQDSAPGMQGKNGKKENKYTGPCPPSGVHHYHFKVYALDSKLDLNDLADKAQLMKAMEGHILASGELTGLYEKIKTKK